MTVYFPCGRIGLKGFFVDNKLPESCGHTVYGVYCENEKTYTIGEILEKLPKEEMDVFQLNELFCRFDKLPEEMQRVYDLTLRLKEPRNIKGMIDLMEHLPEVCVVNGIQNERQLGEFLVENELFDVSFPDEVCHIWITQKSVGNICRHIRGNLFKVRMWKILLLIM